MIFTGNDLKQIDYQYLASLPIDKLLNISFKFFQDLIQLHDFVNQTPLNSSRPPASFPPWQAKPLAEQPSVEESVHQEQEKKELKNKSAATTTTPAVKNEADTTATPDPKVEKKKPGKQEGAQGHGRQVELPITGIEHHRACECIACGQSLTEESRFDARGGLYVLDIEIGSLVAVENLIHILNFCALLFKM